MTWTRVVRCGAVAVLVSAAVACDGSDDVTFNGDGFVTVDEQPSNVGDAGNAATAYIDSGAYQRGLEDVGDAAREWVVAHADDTPKTALVLDIDETALSNLEILKLDHFGRPIDGPCDPSSGAPCGWAAWDQLGRDPAIQPSLELFQEATSLGVAVFFITGRPEDQRAATERNLAAAGYTGYAQLSMTPDGAHFDSAADFKTPIREQIEQQGYRIIANVGDQPSDLLGGHAAKSFLLPNPFYRVL